MGFGKHTEAHSTHSLSRLPGGKTPQGPLAAGPPGEGAEDGQRGQHDRRGESGRRQPPRCLRGRWAPDPWSSDRTVWQVSRSVAQVARGLRWPCGRCQKQCSGEPTAWPPPPRPPDTLPSFPSPLPKLPGPCGSSPTPTLLTPLPSLSSQHAATPAFHSPAASRWAAVFLFPWEVWEVGGDIFGCYFHASFLVTVGGLEASKSLPLTASDAYQPCPPPGRCPLPPLRTEW